MGRHSSNELAFGLHAQPCRHAVEDNTKRQGRRTHLFAAAHRAAWGEASQHQCITGTRTGCCFAGGRVSLTRTRQLTSQAVERTFVNRGMPAGRHPATAPPIDSAIRSRSRHGRRRAPQKTMHLPLRGWAHKAGISVAAAGLVAAVALPSAHAHDHPQRQPPTAGTSAAAEVPAGPSVTADPQAELNFSGSSPVTATAPEDKDAAADSRTDVRPAASGAVEPEPSADEQPVQEAAATTDSGLTAPLANLSVRSGFGYRVNPLTGAAGEMHRGNDYAAACSAAVFSAGDGVVIEAGFSSYGGGNRIVVDHGNGLKTTYNHLSTIGVTVGQSVDRGQQIAGAGTTGNSTGCHLHFEVMVNDQVVNPNSRL